MDSGPRSAVGLASGPLIAVRPSSVVPASTLTGDFYHIPPGLFSWRLLVVGSAILLLVCGGLWYGMHSLRPSSTDLSASQVRAALMPSLPTIEPTLLEKFEQRETVPEPALPAPAVAAPVWAPDRRSANAWPSDHAPVNDSSPVRVRVVTIRAKVTAYTPYDHATTKPEWADGLVAWYPGGRKRHVSAHPYGFATDWGQFPGGATYIHVPGYMSTSFPNFPQSFRVVDDKCGQSRKARRNGWQPIIDARFMTRHSAISGRNAWGSKHLDVEVIFPDDYTLPADLRRWVVDCEWHTYTNGKLVQREPAPLP